MKKIYLLMAGIASMVMASCADDDYSSRYNNPSQTTTASCDKLMTGVFEAGRGYTLNSYWRMYTWDNGVIGRYSKTIGYANSAGSMYAQSDNYANSRWEAFYGMLRNFRVLENVYENESEEMQKNDIVFKHLAEVHIYDHLAQMIDLWGDVPYTKAGYLGITGDVQGSYPDYDSQTELYSMMLQRLGTISNELTSMKGNLTPLAAAGLASQDYYLKGDLDKWIMYANDLRLRLAIRCASNGALVSEGKAAISEILDGNKQVARTFDDNFYFQGDDGSTAEFNYSDAIRDAYKDQSRAPQPMLDVLLTAGKVGIDDYRLPIMYSKNAAGEYKGLSVDEDESEQSTNTSKPEAQRVYSRIDSTTVIYNQYLLMPVLMTAEVDFMRAECYQRGWAAGSAEQAFIDGMVNSTKYYFACNAASTSSYGYKAESEPTEAEVRDYAKKLWDADSDKLNVILSQKWLNFGFLQPTQAWNEIRRTGYPRLRYLEDPTAQLIKSLPNRIRYPGSERNSNTDKYNEQVKKMPNGDDYYTKIFWAM